jgi:hypothetical protein
MLFLFSVFEGNRGKINANSERVYEVRPGKDHRGFDLISDVLPFDGLNGQKWGSELGIETLQLAQW